MIWSASAQPPRADESRAKHRLVKHLLRRGLREPDESRAWTHPWWRWVQSLKFEHEAQQVALADCIAEVLHMGERLARLDKAIDRLVESAPAHMRTVIEALQALRGVAKLTAVTIVTEVGTFKRFRRPTEMMGYTGFVPSSIPAVDVNPRAVSPVPATRTCATCLARPLGMLVIGRG